MSAPTAPRSPQVSAQAQAYVALLLIVALWASYPAAIKLALADMPPLVMAALRCTIASVFLVILLLRSGADTTRALAPGGIRAFVILGITGIFISTQGSYLAISWTTASNVVLLQAASPVMISLGARFYLGERLHPMQWLGVAVSATGVLLVITDGRLWRLRPDDLNAGDLLNIGTLAGWSAFTVYSKRVLMTYHPAMVTTAAYVVGTLLIIPTAILTSPLYPTPRWGSITAWVVVVYQAIAGAVAHVYWSRSVHTVGPARASVFLNLQPVLGLVLASLLLREQVGFWQLMGGAFVLAGVTLTTTGPKRSQ
ncbi:MAG: DMT family transporter [Candidatus Rokubacteria bacterium]|nr:DMT family transporter [Candidatus Rokubacteria bacterium]